MKSIHAPRASPKPLAGRGVPSTLGTVAQEFTHGLQEYREVVPVACAYNNLALEVEVCRCGGSAILLPVKPVRHLAPFAPARAYLSKADDLHEALDVFRGHVARVQDAGEGKLR